MRHDQDTKPIKLANAEHSITIDANTVRVIARVGDIVIGDSAATLTLRESGHEPVYYFPLGSVVQATLRPSSTESNCLYKGDASYYDIVLSTKRFFRMQFRRTGLHTRR
jgi:uncharacterized protein (DUF427 family)